MKMPGWLRRILKAVKRAFVQSAAEEAAKGIDKVVGEEENDNEGGPPEP